MKAIQFFNSKYKVGDYLNYTHNKEVVKGFLRWPAEKTESGRDVIWIHGRQEAIDLSAVIDNDTDVQ